MADHNELGREGEALARTFLERKGLQILECNWRSGRVEIDMIARQGKLLVFIEVKTRRRSRHGLPESAVNRKKARRIISAAANYMDQVEHDGAIRFDVVSVLMPLGKAPVITHIEDAFFY